MEPDSSSDSNRDTPKDLGEVITRPDTPGPMPTYHYPRDTLFELQFCPLAKKRPSCLSEEFNTIDGLWDPDRWSRSFDTSRNNSPLTVGDRDKKREIQIERDYLMRRRPSADPKERLKEEKDGIVLSPQRRSFGTGCHVSQPTLTRQMSCPSDFKDGNDRDRGPRRIGSGRIQLDRDRGEGTRERGGGERDFRAIRDRFDRDDRDRRYDREWDRDGRDSRDSRDPRDRGFRREFEDRDNRRDFGNRHFTSNRDGGSLAARRRDFRQEDEPEWFTEGPISQQDTIELRGFERDKEKETPHRIKEIEEEEDADESTTEEQKTDVADVTDRNGSLETNEPSSPEESSHSDSMQTTSPHSNIFDFNEFFKIDNLPGLNQEGPIPSADIPVVQSRFSQWFGPKPGGSHNSSRHNSRHNSHHNSRHNSRRSSLNDDFGYIVNDLLGGTRSPNVASPPPDQPILFDQSVFSPANSTFADKPQHHSIDFTGLPNKDAIAPMLSNIFQNSLEKQQLGSTSSNFSTQDAEIQLKALLFGKKDSTPSSGTASPGMSSPLNVPGRAKTVAELEADMNQRSSRLPARCFTPPQQPVPPPDIGIAQNFQQQQPPQQQVPSQFQQTPEQQNQPQYQSPPQPNQQVPHHQLPQQQMSPQEIQHQIHMQNQMSHQMQPQPMTPQQMQAHLAQQQQHPPMPQVSIHQSAHSTPRGSQDEGDLTAFNKLLSLMKAGAAAAVESPPKMAVGRPGPQTVSPPPHIVQQAPAPVPHPSMPSLSNSQAAAAAAQNEFFQALQRNKEQQLQIRHQTMNQMRIQQKPLTPQQLQTPASQMSQPQGNQNNNTQPVNDPIINFIKQNPTIITKPASPTPPPQGTPQPPQSVSSMMGMMQNTSTPRAPSPSAGLMGQNLLSQPPSSPRIASPITSLFGQQPPMHLSAPSPINPSQMGQSASITVPAGTTLTSTATIRPPVVPRVPSPQELIAHTQAIMQTALLKKQLEDQRERFIRKQQDSVSFRAKSPNPMVSMKTTGPNVTQTPVMSLATSQSCQTPKPSVSAAFTPTSVMKKMHSDKASEKEKQRQDSVEGENENSAPVKQLVPQDTSQSAVDNLELIQKMNIEQQAKENLPATIMTSMTTHGQPSSIPTQQYSNQDLGIPGINSIAASLASQHDSVTLAEQLSQLSTPTSVQQKQQQVRALIGQGGFQGTPGQPVSVPAATPGRPIVKGITTTSSSAGNSVMTPPVGRPMIGVPQMSTPQLQSKSVEGTPISLQTPSQPHLHRAITGAANPTSVPQVQTPVVPQQKQFSVSPNPLTRPIPPMGAQYGIPITGRIPVQQAMSPNPLLMQQMIQSGISPTAAARVNALNQLNQINHMNHLAMQQQQQQPRIVDPRLQGMRGVYPTVPNLTPRSSVIPTSLGVPVRTPMGVNVAIGRTVSPHPPTQKLINGPVSPGIPIHTSIPTSLLNGNNNITKQDPNLAKWFGTDVLKQQMTSLPPLPGTGQRMMTLEEIERCQQQAVIN